MAGRRYTPRKRAAQQARTRRRIVEAAMALHERLGPRNTTVKAVAEEAGVQRLTVYRHFPDEGSLFEACTAHWLELNPPPGPEAWAEEADPEARCAAALRAFYAYYRRTSPMIAKAYRDVEEVPALAPRMTEMADYLDQLRDALAAPWPAEGDTRSSIRAIIGHCLQFTTWASLDREGLSDADKARLAGRWIASVAAVRGPGP